MSSIEEAVAGLLVTAGLGVLPDPTTGAVPNGSWRIGWGRSPASPDALIHVAVTAGDPPLVTWDDGPAKVRFPGLEILVRAQGWARGLDKIEAVRLALDGQGPLDVGGRRYHVVGLRQSAPFYLGDDETGRARFSLNFDTAIEEGV